VALTLIEIKDRLKQIDEVDLLELLEISSEDLVERFTDLIEDNFDKLEREVE
jgi:anion-transporting  ArsA/GET3 family ATPase